MRGQLKVYRLSVATFYGCINTIYLYIKSLLDNKMSIFEEYGAFNLVLLIPKHVLFLDLNISISNALISSKNATNVMTLIFNVVIFFF